MALYRSTPVKKKKTKKGKKQDPYSGPWNGIV